MIITRLSGGLGNQLFQYAVGLSLSVKNKDILKTDIISLTNGARRYSLDGFNISGAVSTEKDILDIRIPSTTDNSFLGKVRRKLFRATEYHKLLNKKRYIVEPNSIFFPEILEIKNSCYLNGNWQSEKYFIDIADIVRKEFSLKNKLSEKASVFLNEIKSTESPVSIHIRRGDYISNKKTNSFHGTCSPDYYKKATDIIEKTVTSPKYFIFSDDIEWVEKNLKLNFPTVYVSGNNIPDYEEMVLMSKCKHNIIANSSFSWWGAWLNNNPNKIVIAPKKWFNTNTNTKDLIPENWITI